MPFALKGGLVATCSGGVRSPSPGALPSLLEETPISLKDLTRESMEAFLESPGGERPGLVERSEGNLLDGECVASSIFRFPLCEVGDTEEGDDAVGSEAVPFVVRGLRAGEGRRSCDPA